MSLEIKEVKTKSELKHFINFVYDLYKGNQYWCPPIFFDEMNTLHWDKNPAFEYCEARYWMAYRDGKAVGRIAGMLNTKSNAIWNEKNIRFGWFDFIDDAEVPEKLLQCVVDWGKEKGMNHIHGPLGFTDMDREGMMVKGFEELGSIASYYNYAYYPTRIEALGYAKDVDWVQNLFSIPDAVPEKISRFAELVQQKYKLHILEAKNKKEFLPYARGIFETLNKCFKDLYGFVPLTTKQIDMLVKAYFGFVRPEFVGVVLNEANEVVGFGVALPSLTKALQKCNGKLFPFGFIHLLKALKSSDFIDMYINGVDPEYQNKGVPSVYFNYMCQNFIKNKAKWALSNPQLEENSKALNLWHHFDARQHITRRCYTKEI
jgi:ribosomal protein S18 acetylase RimI-like enzyme